MSVLNKFRELNGKTVSRKQIENLILDAKNENETEVIYRLSKILLDNPDTQNFDITLNQYATSLNAPRHKGLYKEALTECGRLKKGWRFIKGSVIQISKPKRKTKKTTAKEVKLKKTTKPTETKKEFKHKRGKKVQGDFIKWFKHYYSIDLDAVKNLDLKPKRNYFNITPRKLKKADLMTLERFANKENDTFKISLTDNGVDRVAVVVVQQKPLKTALNGGRKRKTGLKTNGRLKKGYKYAKGGKIVKVSVKKKVKKK